MEQLMSIYVIPFQRMESALQSFGKAVLPNTQDTFNNECKLV